MFPNPYQRQHLPAAGGGAEFAFADVEFAIAAEDGDERIITATLKDAQGTTVAIDTIISVFLCDANGKITNTVHNTAYLYKDTTPGDTIAIFPRFSASALTDFLGFAISAIDGVATFIVGQNAAGTVYVCVPLPDGSLAISGAITFAA